MADSEFNKRVGMNVANLRSTMTQQALADAMRERGHRWTQATVWSIETGDRALKLEEALSLVDVLGVGAWGAIRLGKDAFTELEPLLNKAFKVRERTVDALFDYMKARAALADSLLGREALFKRASEAQMRMAEDLIGPAGDPAVLIDNARQVWIHEPLPENSAYGEDNPLERSMQDFVQEMEDRYQYLWGRIQDARGETDGEHPEAT